MLRTCALCPTLTSPPVRPAGFVSNMSEWMGACDCVVTKAGPGTIAEALIRGVPLLLNGCVPCQEEGNIPYVVENGVGAFNTDPEQISKIISRWFSPEGAPELEAMAQRAKKLGRPQASFDIVRELAVRAQSFSPAVCVRPDASVVVAEHSNLIWTHAADLAGPREQPRGAGRQAAGCRSVRRPSGAEFFWQANMRGQQAGWRGHGDGVTLPAIAALSSGDPAAALLVLLTDDGQRLASVVTVGRHACLEAQSEESAASLRAVDECIISIVRMLPRWQQRRAGPCGALLFPPRRHLLIFWPAQLPPIPRHPTAARRKPPLF